MQGVLWTGFFFYKFWFYHVVEGTTGKLMHILEYFILSIGLKKHNLLKPGSASVIMGNHKTNQLDPLDKS